MNCRTRVAVAQCLRLIAISAAAWHGKAQDTAWIRVTTDAANTPAGREGAVMVYDERREVVVMQGGNLAGKADWDPSSISSETWEWDGTDWTLVSTDGPATVHQGMAYDAARGVTVLYGGRDPQGLSGGFNTKINLNDTWEWDGESWTKIPTGQGQVPVSAAAMVYDPNRGKVIRHGGLGDGEAFNQSTTWEWDGHSWTQIPTGRGLRIVGYMFYDTHRDSIIIIGITSLDSRSNQTWEFDGSRWTQLTAAASPQRLLYECVYDTHRNLAVVYGGLTTSPTRGHDDTWEWDGVQWAEVPLGRNPGVRGLHAMAYDSKRRKTVMFGGSRTTHVEPYSRDTWEYGFRPLRLTSVTRDTNQVVTVQWTGEAPPYRIRRCTTLTGAWQDVGGPTDAVSATVSEGDEHGTVLYRIESEFGVTPP